MPSTFVADHFVSACTTGTSSQPSDGTHYLDDKLGMAAVWAFNVWGFGDLLNAVVRGLLFTLDGASGATFWIPALIAPLLLVTHVYIFVELFAATPRRQQADAGRTA